MRFQAIVEALHDAKLTRLFPERVYATVVDSNEFMAVLSQK